MDVQWISLVASVAVPIILAAASWGMLKGEIKSQQDQLTKIATHVDSVLQHAVQLDNLQRQIDQFVPRHELEKKWESNAANFRAMDEKIAFMREASEQRYNTMLQTFEKRMDLLEQSFEKRLDSINASMTQLTQTLLSLMGGKRGE